MAAQVTHLALSEMIFEKYLVKFNKKDFFIGTTFPDIRYLGHIRREKSHFNNISFTDILEQDNSFHAGILYHSFVDDFRENWMVKNNIYKLIPSTHRATQAVKLFEDRYYYRNINDWRQIISYYEDVLEDELGFDMNKEVVFKWHKALGSYFRATPTLDATANLINDIGMPSEIRDEILHLIAQMEDNEQLIDIIKQFHDDYNMLIDKINL